MATYVPGSSQYLPQPTAFTPDYKFLGNVLDVRTDRYNTNYEALNDLYGKVVYADLSRQDTNQVRSQYVKDIAPKIHQIADMDLSLQQNVEAAKGVFAPFFQDDLLVKDMVVTKQYQREMSYADTLLNSLDRTQREKYWQTGIDAMKYQMQDFIEADRNKALQMAGPQYVEDVDLYETSLKLLQESGLFDEEIQAPPEFSPDGRWIIKTSGGAAVSKPALQYLRRSLLDDPNVQRAYYTSAYVEQRKYVDNAIQSGAFNDMDQAQRAWANQTITKAEEQLAILTSDQEAELAEEERKLENKKQFTEKHGDSFSGLTGGTMAEAIAAYDADKQNLQDKSTQLADASDYKQTSGEVPTNTLLNRAYQLMMGTNIDTDMQAAAITFGDSKKKIDLEVNEYKLEEIRYKNQRALENLRHRNAKKEIEKAEEVQQGNALINAAGGGSDVDIVAEDEPTDVADDGYERNVATFKDQKLAQENAEIDLLVETQEAIQTKLNGGGTITVFSTSQDGYDFVPRGEEMSVEDAKEYYKNNPEALVIGQSYMKVMMENQDNAAMQANPNDAMSSDYALRRQKYQTLERNGKLIDDAEQVFIGTVENNFNLAKALEGKGEGISRLVDGDTDGDGVKDGQGFPTIFNKDENGRYSILDKETYIENFISALEGGDLNDYKSTISAIWNQTGKRDELLSILRREAAAEALPSDTGLDLTYFLNAKYGPSRDILTDPNITDEKVKAAFMKKQYEDYEEILQSKILTLATRSYNAQKEAINKGYGMVDASLNEKIKDLGTDLDAVQSTITEIDTGYQTFNADAFFKGHSPYSGLSEVGYKIQTTINPQVMPEAGSTAEALGVEFFTNFNQTPKQQLFVHAGGWNRKDLGTKDQIISMDESSDIAKAIIDQLAIDLTEYGVYKGESKPDAATPSFELSQSYITEEDGSRYMKYEVSPSRDWLATQKGKGLLTSDGDDLGDDINNFSTITVLIPEENVTFKSEALYRNNDSYVERQMALSPDGIFLSDYPGGAQIKYSPAASGATRVAYREYVYDSESNSIIPDPDGWVFTDVSKDSINLDLVHTGLENDAGAASRHNSSLAQSYNNETN